jgi:hypothetical protein
MYLVEKCSSSLANGLVGLTYLIKNGFNQIYKKSAVMLFPLGIY